MKLTIPLGYKGELSGKYKVFLKPGRNVKFRDFKLRTHQVPSQDADVSQDFRIWNNIWIETKV